MKTLFKNALLLGVAISTLFFTACDSETEMPLGGPSISVTTTPSDATVEVNEAFSFVATVNAAAGFNTLRIESFTEAGGGTIDLTGYKSEYTRNDLGLDAGATSATVEFTPLSLPIAGEFTIRLLAVDEAGETGSLDIALSITSAPISNYTAVLLGAQGNAEAGFFDALKGERYGFAAARDASGTAGSVIDFAYYYGNTNKNTIAAIDDAGLNSVYSSVNLPISGVFGTRNATRFRVTNLSPGDFDAINNSAGLVEAADSELNVNTSSTQLSVGSVIAFELDADRGGYVGLVKVTQINDTNGNGTITVEVKSEQEVSN
jgi:hypothetical protein